MIVEKAQAVRVIESVGWDSGIIVIPKGTVGRISLCGTLVVFPDPIEGDGSPTVWKIEFLQQILSKMRPLEFESLPEELKAFNFQPFLDGRRIPLRGWGLQ